MREIEIKARVHDHTAIIAELTARGEAVTEPVTQHDVVYGPAGVDGDDDSNTAPWLRVRSETRSGATTHYFTLKKSVTNQLDSIEHETTVTDDAELHNIIKHLDFELYSDLTKTRQKAHVGDIELCLDYLPELGENGYFIEAEKLTDDDVSYETVAQELWRLFERFGVSKADEVTDGYDVLLNKHRKNATIDPVA